MPATSKSGVEDLVQQRSPHRGRIAASNRRCSDGFDGVRMSLLCGGFLDAKEARVVFFSTVYNIVHDFLYDLSRKLPAIVDIYLCVFGL